MSYEIPQQLEYKEKIIFGLTFSQLLYAIIFLPIALALLLKPPFGWAVRISLALIPSVIASLFMFTNLPKVIKNWLKWQRWKKCQQDNPKMKKYLNVDKIEGYVLHLQ